MRCNAKIWKSTGVTIGNINIDFNKEYCVEVKSRIFEHVTFKEVGKFFIYDGLSIMFETNDNVFFGLDRISNVYEKAKIKEDKTLYMRCNAKIWESKRR